MSGFAFTRRDADSPPPCGEGLGVGVAPLGERRASGTTPIPLPSPQGGREARYSSLSSTEV
jgi:hypothetical protein